MANVPKHLSFRNMKKAMDMVLKANKPYAVELNGMIADGNHLTIIYTVEKWGDEGREKRVATYECDKYGPNEVSDYATRK